MDGLTRYLCSRLNVYTGQDTWTGWIDISTPDLNRIGHVDGLDRSLYSRLNIYTGQDTWIGWRDISAPDLIYTQVRTRGQVG